MSSRSTSDADALAHHARDLGVDVAAEHAAAVVAYVNAMLDENTRVNLTAVRDRDAALVLHALDALGLLLVEHDASEALDLGTGNGFPGVAVAICDPDSHVTLLDRTRKKLDAIDRALATADVAREGLTCLHADASQLPALHPGSRYSLITCRAVGAPTAIAKLAAPLLTPSGRLALWLAEDTEAPEQLGKLRRREIAEYELPAPAGRRRRIATYS